VRIVVTGAAGFLGRHVASYLQSVGHEVVGFDRDPIENGGSFDTVQGDFLDVESLLGALEGADAICHIGAIGDVYLAAEQPALAASVNVTGSANIAAAARSVGARVVYASTWEVYGKPEYEPLDESHPTRPDHPYNITKLAGEQILLAADHLHDVPVVALRLGTAFGSGLRPNSVFRIFIDRARRGEPITIQGDGSQGRQFTHASDIARAFAAACESEARGMAFNTVAHEMVSIKQLAELVVARFPTELTFGSARPGDIDPAFVSSERIRDVLGWSASVEFESGLDELIQDVVEDG
jgi:UDP-glucose 4-epimerase